MQPTIAQMRDGAQQRGVVLLLREARNHHDAGNARGHRMRLRGRERREADAVRDRDGAVFETSKRCILRNTGCANIQILRQLFYNNNSKLYRWRHILNP